MKKFLILAVLFGFYFIGCKKKDEKAMLDVATECVKKQDVTGSIAAYENFLKEFPNGENTSTVLYNLGRIYQDKTVLTLDMEQSDRKAIEYYQQIADKFPKSEQTPAALFNIGFLQANELKNFDEAKKAYERFIREFPNDKLAPSAKSEIENLGVPPEEIIRRKTAEAK